MYSIIYFSPTGNVLHLAEKLSGHLGTDKSKILPLEFVDYNKLEKNNHLVLIYPVHGFNAPRTVKRFVKNLPSNIYDFVSMIGVGCTTNWFNGAVSSDLRKLFTKKNYTIILDEILAMPLTFIMSFPDEIAYKLIDESEKRIEDISLSIIKRKKTIIDVKAKSHLLNFLGKGEQAAARLFGLELHANKDCNSCGTCWTNCPEKNIKCGKNGKPAFGFKCLMCMRCIYNCPQKAISPRFSKFIPISKGYSFKKFRP